MALRLVAMCQSGKEPSVANMALSDPPPNFVGVSASSVTKNKWTIEVLFGVPGWLMQQLTLPFLPLPSLMTS